MDPNDAHGITGGDPIPFNSVAEIPAKLDKLLIDHDVTIHRNTWMKKYLD